MQPIRVLLADDHEIVRAGLRSLLAGYPEVVIVGEAGGGDEAVSLAAQLRPDVVLMDITMPGLDGVEATRRIKAATPEVNVLALTIHEDEAYFFEMLNAGASGYVSKRVPPDELMMAIRTAAAGRVFLHPMISQALVQDYLRRARQEAGPADDKLTDRQQEVLALLADGVPGREIAARLGISVKTVERHRENIMERLNLHSRAELVKYALRKGLIQLEE